MTAIAPLLAQTLVTSCLAAWMLAGVYNNWRFPRLNEAAVAMVMRFEMMEQTYPEDFAVVKHRKVTNPKLIRLMFYAMVLSETLAAALLSAGAVLLMLALGGGFPVDLGRFVALLGALAFTANWTGFLIGGEYFCYWYCHFGSQATHMMLAIWGTLLIVLLVLG